MNRHKRGLTLLQVIYFVRVGKMWGESQKKEAAPSDLFFVSPL